MYKKGIVLFLVLFLCFSVSFAQQMEGKLTGEKGEIYEPAPQVTARQMIKAYQKSLEKANLSEGFESGAIPMDWTVINNDGGSQLWGPTTTNPNSGTYAVRVRYETSSLDNDDWLITPPLNIQAGVPDTLKFWVRTYSGTSADPFEVKLSTTGTDPADFTTSLFDTTGYLGSYMQLSFPLDAYDGNIVYVGIHYTGAYDWYCYADDFEGPEVYVPPIPSFYTPFSDIDLNQANSFVPAGTPVSEWVYITNTGGSDLIVTSVNTSKGEITTNFVPDEMTIAPGESDSVLVTWTPAEAAMDTGWVEFVSNAASTPDTVNFTLASVPTGAWVVDFEAPSGDWVSPLGYGFSVYGTYGYSTINQHWGNQGNWWSSSWADTSHLTTARLDLTSGPTSMGFYHKGLSTGDDTIRVWVSQNPTMPDSWMELGSVTNTGTDWKFQEYSLAAYAGSDSVWVRWTYEYPSGGTSGSSWYMDDLYLPQKYVAATGLLYASASQIDYGTVSVGSMLSAEVTLANTGGQAVTINSITSDNGAFTVQSSLTSIASLGTGVFSIEFAPDAGGVVSGNVTIDHDGVNGKTSLVIQVTGNGLAPYALPYSDGFESTASLDNYVITGMNSFNVEITDGYSTVDPFAGSYVLEMNGGTTSSPGYSYVELTLDLTGLTGTVKADFQVATYGMDATTSIDSFTVDVYDGTWHSNVVEHIGTGTMQWVQEQIVLSDYNLINGFKIRFVGRTSSTFDKIFIDELNVQEFAGADAGITEIMAGNGSLLVGNPAMITATVYNFGGEEISNFNVAYKVDDGGPVTETFTDTLAPFSSKPFSFATMYTPSAAGLVNIQAYSLLNEDTNVSNDTTAADFNVLEAKSVPFNDDFETSASLLNYAYGAEGGDAVFIIDDGYSSVTPISGDSMLGIWGAANNVPITATADLYLDLSAAANPAISFAIGCYSLESSSDSGIVDIYDGTWHKKIVGITSTTAMTQYTFNVADEGWNKAADFIVRFCGVLNYPMNSDGVFVDNIMVFEDTGPKYTVSGTVSLEGMSAPDLDGTIVTLDGPMKNVWADTTDGSGYYEFANLDSGSYAIMMERTGYITAMDTVLVDANTTVDVTLMKIPALTELVEGFEGTFPPDYWTGDIGASPQWRASGTAHTGSGSAYAGYGASPPEGFSFVTPKLDMSGAASHELKFWWRETYDTDGNSDSTFVEVSTDAANWTTLAVLKGNVDSPNWLQESFDLSSYSAETEFWVRWRYVSDGGLDAWWFYLDDVSLGADLIVAPTAMSASVQPGENAVDLSWNFSAKAAKTMIEKDVFENADNKKELIDMLSTGKVSASAIAQSKAFDHFNIYRSTDGSAFSMLNTTMVTMYSDTGLTFGSDYWYYVTAVYTSGESDPSDTVKATPFDWLIVDTYPHQEGFENSGEWPDGWWTIDYNVLGGIFNWHVLDSTGGNQQYVNSGQYSAASMWNGTNPSDEYLVSPVFDLSGNSKQDATLEFYFGYNTTWLGATLQVLASGDRGATWDTLWVLDANNGVAPWGWTNASIDLSAYVGGEAMVAFNYTGLDGDLLCLDDISIDVVTGIAEEGNLPKVFDLAQNFPNPFNPSTTIKYQLPKRAEVSITVYNALGQIVKTLVGNSVEPGYHQVTWDGTNQNGAKVASGIYIYRMVAGDFVKAHKLILMK